LHVLKGMAVVKRDRGLRRKKGRKYEGTDPESKSRKREWREGREGANEREREGQRERARER